ncbi:MAG: thioredoxin family protein [Chitinophagaceae bacterium]
MQKVIACLLMLLLVGFQKYQRPALWQPWSVINSALRQMPKPILIDVYTDWCHYCKQMDNSVYKHDSVVAYLQKHFYRYKLNAEGNDTLRWNGKLFQYHNLYKVHEMALYVSGGNVAYPITAVIDTNGQPHYQLGALNVNAMELMLRYFIEHAPQETKAQFAARMAPRWK